MHKKQLQPKVRIKFDSWGLQWFNPLDRRWIVLNDLAPENVGRQLAEMY